MRQIYFVHGIPITTRVAQGGSPPSYVIEAPEAYYYVESRYRRLPSGADGRKVLYLKSDWGLLRETPRREPSLDLSSIPELVGKAARGILGIHNQWWRETWSWMREEYPWLRKLDKSLAREVARNWQGTQAIAPPTSPGADK